MMKPVTLAVILLAVLGCATEAASPRPPTATAVRISIVATPSPTRWFVSSTMTATPEPTLITSSPTPPASTPVPDAHSQLPTAEAEIASRHSQAPPQATPVAPQEQVEEGQFLFYALGCFYCHGVKAEGAVGPRLARTSISLDKVISQVYQPEDEMPAFSKERVSERDLAAIYAYLHSLDPLGPRPTITADSPDSAAGATLYRYFGCFGCHGSQGEGKFGPPLAGIALSFKEMRARVREPKQPMPPFGPEYVSDEELAHIYAFLQSLAQ
ncbi:MAG TPA: hypothetical protein DEP84_23155 [Chloroflexi bacterium]|nr:hypothetical protein [Chloroflexota bacterium]